MKPEVLYLTVGLSLIAPQGYGVFTGETTTTTAELFIIGATLAGIYFFILAGGMLGEKEKNKDAVFFPLFISVVVAVITSSLAILLVLPSAT